MTTYIALLRAINLAGHNAVAMSDLRDWLTKLGFAEPRTLLQSGNVTFRAASRSAAQVERTIEAEAQKGLRLEIDFFVRTVDEWRDVIARNPFRAEAARDPARLLVMFLKADPPSASVGALRAAIRGRALVRTNGRHAYVVFPDGVGRSRLTSALMEKKLGTRGTGRNWNTVMKLAAMTANVDDET